MLMSREEILEMIREDLNEARKAADIQLEARDHYKEYTKKWWGWGCQYMKFQGMEVALDCLLDDILCIEEERIFAGKCEAIVGYLIPSRLPIPGHDRSWQIDYLLLITACQRHVRRTNLNPDTPGSVLIAHRGP